MVISIIHFSGWKMTKTLGYSMFGLYVLFVIQDLLRTYGYVDIGTAGVFPENLAAARALSAGDGDRWSVRVTLAWSKCICVFVIISDVYGMIAMFLSSLHVSNHPVFQMSHCVLRVVAHRTAKPVLRVRVSSLRHRYKQWRRNCKLVHATAPPLRLPLPC